MDKHLNKIEEQLQKLILSKDFDELSSSEKSFVLHHSSAYDYQMERKIVLDAESLFDDEDKIVPLPLAVQHEEEKKGLLAPIPLYQSVILAVAAACIVFFFMPRTQVIEKNPETKTEYISKVDTIFQTIQNTDTIYQTIEKPVYLEKKIYVDRYITANNPSSKNKEPQLFEIPKSNPIQLNMAELKNKGTSMKNDPTANLLQGINFGE
jgi:hypothetical protein